MAPAAGALGEVGNIAQQAMKSKSWPWRRSEKMPVYSGEFGSCFLLYHRKSFYSGLFIPFLKAAWHVSTACAFPLAAETKGATGK